MDVLGQFAVEPLQEHLVGDLAHVHAGLVQHGEDALVLLLHQVHDDLVVEVVDLSPRAETGRGLVRRITRVWEDFQDLVAIRTLS